MKVIVTGAAGFIGSNLSAALLEEGYTVIGVDSLNDYYSKELKQDRLKKLNACKKFKFLNIDIVNQDEVLSLFENEQPEFVIHLAAQAGVRYSLENPNAYVESNVIGFYNILEACKCFPVEHLIYASSSSVYGANKKVPFEETDNVDSPVSLYAATKKSNELMAHTYSHLYGIPSSGLRFFTVYGPMGRPDMAYFAFVDKYFKGESIKIFNSGDLENDLYRDFTYIDDITEGILRLMHKPPKSKNGKGLHDIYNIGNSQPVKLMDFIRALEESLSKSLGKNIVFEKEFEDMKPGDVPATYADTSKLENVTGFKPKTSLRDGLQKFTDWYVEYYKYRL